MTVVLLSLEGRHGKALLIRLTMVIVRYLRFPVVRTAVRAILLVIGVRRTRVWWLSLVIILVREVDLRLAVSEATDVSDLYCLCMVLDFCGGLG